MSKSMDLGLNGDNAIQESVPSLSVMDFNPRSYQKSVFDVAMTRNTIAVLETGSGKTMIAVMLIREIGQAIKSGEVKRLIIFLAPTVILVKQQCEFIKANTNFDVEEYYGAKGIDDWTKQSWEKEIAEHDVFVMTPQILLDALRNAFLNLEIVSLIIIDECHHATRNHPYTKLMKEFYHKSINKPRIFGMTASPVARKGVSSSMDCEDQLSDLESLLDSQIYTIEDKAEMELHVPCARETCRFYDKEEFNLSDLKSKIESSWSKFDAELINLQGSTRSSYKDVDEYIKTLRQRISNDHAKILNCIEDLGLICAYEAVKICLENTPQFIKECETYREISMKHKNFLEEAFNIIAESLPGGDYFLDHQFDYLQAINIAHISPKLYTLLQIFLSFGKDQEILCLIFVDRIVTAKVIERFVKKVAVLGHLTVSYVTGTNASANSLTPKIQKEKLESFSSGKVNLLFSTDVLREGIHVPNCSSVICFDLPQTVCCYVQSRGRARQNDSQYIIMLERGNTEQRDRLFDFIRSEWLMTNTALNRDPDVWNLKACTYEETKTYVVDPTGALVTAESSVNLIHRYCGKLPADRYYSPRPIFEFKYVEDSCQCTMNLPASAAFQEIVGPLCRSKNLAKQLVCLEACKKLHELGALDDHLVPSAEDVESNCTLGTKESAGAGTTKRKELHGTTRIQALSGNWGEKLDGATFHAYRFQFCCSTVSETYNGFMLLIESQLDDDVGNIELDLFLIKKIVKATISSCGQIQLDSEKIAKSKCFHELFFNGLFGKLFTGSKFKKPRKFLLQKGAGSLWISSNMYLLLPLETLGASTKESWKINWRGIYACTDAVEFLKKNSSSGAEHYNVDREQSSPGTSGSSISETIYFANILVGVDEVKNMVVVAMHTGKIYSVLNLVSTISAESPFEQNAGGSSKYSSYAEYFKQKYGILLMHPGQPLLLLKQSHKPHNLLSKNDEDASRNKVVDDKQRQYVHMPPELLVSVDLPVQTLKSFYLLPSLMHRLESLMLASQLRKEIDCDIPNLNIPSSLILEALTTPRACETFSMERLELLGDSVLKYAVSCDLFLRYPKKHEGHLSARRMQAICNSTLHKFGIGRKLQEYIRDNAFIPRSWVAPGQQPTFNVPCNCGVDTLEVPLVAKFQTEDPKIKLVACCSMGHRWMCSKTISDCVEAIVGAYYVSGGLEAALHVMKWLGMNVDFDLSLVDEAISSASERSYGPTENELESLELDLNYTFSSKFLLQEAVTHASMHERGIGYSYERLEFLGDALLDLLITWHLYQSYTDVDPGELTDLRSACVSNENFAKVVVRKELHKHLRHSSTSLLSQIAEYVNSFGSDEAINPAAGPSCPKALGDLLESIAGAMLIDAKFNLDRMWKVLEPLLHPLATPETIELAPLRTLNELCDSLGYFVKEKCVNENETVHSELRLQLNDVLLVGKGYDRKTKAARGKAASQLLKALESRGITYTWGNTKKRKQDLGCIVDSSLLDSTEECMNGQPKKKRQKMETQFQDGSCGVPGIPKSDPRVIESIDMKKGGPRRTLYELCKKLHWMMPTFDTTEEKSSVPITFSEGGKTIERFNSFVSKIMLNVPNQGTYECTGKARPDKKSSHDSAAVALLYKLEEEGHIIILSQRMIEDQPLVELNADREPTTNGSILDDNAARLKPLRVYVCKKKKGMHSHSTDMPMDNND